MGYGKYELRVDKSCIGLDFLQVLRSPTSKCHATHPQICIGALRDVAKVTLLNADSSDSILIAFSILFERKPDTLGTVDVSWVA